MLSLSVKSKYGLAAMYELGIWYNTGPVQIRQIADAHDIPQNYLEQLLVDLKKAGLVTSFRGQHGGYELAKPPGLIEVGDVLRCLEGPLNLSRSNGPKDALSFFWQGAEEQIQAVFDVSLEQIVLDAQRLENVVSYSI